MCVQGSPLEWCTFSSIEEDDETFVESASEASGNTSRFVSPSMSLETYQQFNPKDHRSQHSMGAV